MTSSYKQTPNQNEQGQPPAQVGNQGQRFPAPPPGTPSTQPVPGQMAQGQGQAPGQGQRPGPGSQLPMMPVTPPSIFPGGKAQPIMNNNGSNGGQGQPGQPVLPAQPGQAGPPPPLQPGQPSLRGTGQLKGGLRDRPLPGPEQRPAPPNTMPASSKQVPGNRIPGAPQQPPTIPNTPLPNRPNEQANRLRIPNPPASGNLQVRQHDAKPLVKPAPMPDPDMERIGNQLVLYRNPNFFVRTAYRPQHVRNPLATDLSTTLVPKVMPQQEQRIASSDTRFMPMITSIDQEKKKRFPLPSWLEAILVVVGLAASLVVHTLNMFNFPRYELDEGTYMSSAWAVMNGLITPYAYGYGHPPIGWIQIAAWVQLLGGFFTFGNALNTGRVIMLFYALGCSLLVYLIIRHMGSSRTAGLLAMIIFSLSPLSITYQRQTLLDNIATFWLLVALFLLVVGKSRLFYVAGAAIAFGIAILSKEIFILFVPVMIYATLLYTSKFQRKFAMVAFIYTAIAITSAFVLMAILRSELFPAGWLPWDTHQHLSLIGTYVNQVQRGNTEGSFLTSWDTWWVGDKVLMICSIVTVAFNLIAGWWNRKQLLLALFAISFWLLLIRGGVVLSFYLIPLIPLIAMNAAFAANTILGWLGKLVRFDLVRAVLILGVIAAIVPYDIQASTLPFTQHPTTAQTQAMSWIRTNIPRNSFVVINSYLYMDMRQPGGASVGSGAVFPFAHVYFNVATDPEIYKLILNGNSDRIDYIVADSEMLHDIQGDPTYKIINAALNNSIPVASFKSADHSLDLVITIYQVQHKFGPPLVVTPPKSNGGSTQLADRGTILVDRRTSLG